MPVDHQHKLYRKWKPVWTACRAILGGAWEVKLKDVAESDILPPLSGHENNERAYLGYLKGAHFFPGAARAREGFVGLLNADPAEITAPSSMKPFLEDVTGSGTPVKAEEFVASAIGEAVDVWRFGILTDFPEQPVPRSLSEAPSLRDVEAKRLRPRWKLYQAEDISDWHFIDVGGQEVLAYVVLHEELEAPAPTEQDEFAWSEVEQWRVLDRALPPAETEERRLPLEPRADGRVYRARLYRRDDAGNLVQAGATSWPRMNGRLMPDIPFDATPPEKPMLADAVDVNAAHFRNSAAREHGLLFTGNPMAYLFGYDPDLEEEVAEGMPAPPKPVVKWKFGSSEMLVLKSALAKIGIVSAKAEDLSALRDAMLEKREELVLIVGRILAQEKKAAETARTEELRREGDKGVLTKAAQTVSAVLTRALMRARDWMQVEGEVEVRVSTEFFEQGLTAEEATALAELWVKYGLLAKSDVRKNLRRGGSLDRDRTDADIDAEIARDVIPSIAPEPGDGEGEDKASGAAVGDA